MSNQGLQLHYPATQQSLLRGTEQIMRSHWFLGSHTALCPFKVPSKGYSTQNLSLMFKYSLTVGLKCEFMLIPVGSQTTIHHNFLQKNTHFLILHPNGQNSIVFECLPKPLQITTKKIIDLTVSWSSTAMIKVQSLLWGQVIGFQWISMVKGFHDMY